MPTNRSVDPDLAGVTPKKDRSGLCSFTFADGRQCRTPRRAGHSHLCAFHARKEAQSLAAEQAGEDISSFLSGDLMTACDLSSALARLFSAVAKGDIKPKTASTLAYLGQTLIQSIQIAQDEYINAFSTDSWREAVRSSFAPPDQHEIASGCRGRASARRFASPVPGLPSPSASVPHTPLPPTSAEFAQRVVTGRNLS